MQQGVDQGVLLMTGARVHDQTGGFIDDDQIGIFKKNVERDGFRLIVDLLRWGLDQFDFISAPDEIARPRPCPVQRHGTVANQLLQAGA